MLPRSHHALPRLLWRWDFFIGQVLSPIVDCLRGPIGDGFGLVCNAPGADRVFDNLRIVHGWPPAPPSERTAEIWSANGSGRRYNFVADPIWKGNDVEVIVKATGQKRMLVLHFGAERAFVRAFQTTGRSLAPTGEDKCGSVKVFPAYRHGPKWKPNGTARQ